ncbi:P-loop containing nucleoside triphosphate hydrolase protein [Phellopilus nigrolimitatus]|nr:P-loop containing nucleoside triphosphate hydrolase protein [Phellopilus nigrolimitatus]
MLSLPSKSKASGPVFPFFNPYISDLGLLPRDIPGYYSFTLEDEDRALKEEMLRPLEPRWHQYVGLAAMAKHFFNGENVVLADGVGVGKTLQCFMVMSYLRHMKVTEAQRKGVLPPIAAASQKWGWGGPEKVFPQGHILVCVPNMLTDQWESEALRFLDARYWNIVKYPQSKRDAPKFWSEVWSEKVVTQKDKEEEESVTTILIVSYSTLRMEAKLCLGSENTRQLNMSVGPTVNASFAKDTVFAQKWALTFFDEAQVLRTEGALLRGAHALRIRSGSLVFCSATPLHNSERDLVSLGLALGLRDSDDLVILEKDLRRALSKISRENSGNPTTEDRQVGANDIVAGRAPTGIEGEKAQKKQDYRLSIVQQMRQCFKNTVIRRRAQSTDNNGVQISGLLELVKRTLDVDLREDEKVAFEVVKSRAAGQLQNCPDPSSLPTKTFFNEYRLAIGHLGFAGGATPAPFTSKEDWIARRSTKWKLIVDLICALLRNDDGPFPEKIENNELVIPDVRTDENAKGKVVVYVEFTRTLDHLISGMEFEGLRPLSVTGKQSAKKRQHNISEFKDPRRNNRVLVLSSVGNAGLNLHEARFLIFADTVWSGQQEEQIIGRLHRQPNRQQVHVYIPRASGTSDVILSRMSRNKEDLLGAFMNTDDDDDPFVSPPGASVDPEEEDLDLSKAHNEGMKPPKATKAPKGKAQAGLPKAQTGQPKAQSTPAEKRTHPSDPRSTTTGGQGSQPPPVPAGGADSQRDVDRSPTTTQGVGAPPDQQTETQPVSHVRQSSTQGETRGTATVDPNIRVRSRPATPAPAPDIEMGPPSDVGQSSIPPQFPSEKPGPPVPPTEKPVRGATKDGDEIPFPENGERASMEDMLLFASQASVKRVKQFAGTLSVEKAAQFKTANASRKAKITRQLNKAKKAQAEAAEKNRSSTITSTLEQEQQLQALKISSRDPSRSEGEDGPASFSAKGKDPEPRQAPEVNSMPTSSINQFSTPPPEQLRPQTSSFTNDSIDGFDPPDPPSDNGGSPVPKSPPHKKLRGESSTFSFDSSRASGSQLQGSSGLGQRLEDLGTRGLTAKPKKTPRRRKAIE